MMIGFCKKLLLIDELKMCVEALIDCRTKYPPIWIVIDPLRVQHRRYAVNTSASPHNWNEAFKEVCLHPLKQGIVLFRIKVSLGARGILIFREVGPKRS